MLCAVMTIAHILDKTWFGTCHELCWCTFLAPHPPQWLNTKKMIKKPHYYCHNIMVTHYILSSLFHLYDYDQRSMRKMKNFSTKWRSFWKSGISEYKNNENTPISIFIDIIWCFSVALWIFLLLYDSYMSPTHITYFTCLPWPVKSAKCIIN